MLFSCLSPLHLLRESLLSNGDGYQGFFFPPKTLVHTRTHAHPGWYRGNTLFCTLGSRGGNTCIPGALEIQTTAATKTEWKSHCKTKGINEQARVVRKVDRAIQRLFYYPADSEVYFNTSPLEGTTEARTVPLHVGFTALYAWDKITNSVFFVENVISPIYL